MAQITLDIPAGQVNRVQNAFASQFGYTGLTPQGAAETKAEFTKRMLIKFIKDTVKSVETGPAIETARQTVDSSIESQVTVT
jgi:hypothetical protein